MSKCFRGYILVVLFLLSALSGVSTTGVLYCEGTICGITPWVCCCEGRDEKYSSSVYTLSDAVKHPGAKLQASVYLNGCACHMVMRSAMERELPTSIDPMPVPHATILPALFVLDFNASLTLVEVGQVDTRGPPLRPVSTNCLVSRAPPPT